MKTTTTSASFALAGLLAASLAGCAGDAEGAGSAASESAGGPDSLSIGCITTRGTDAFAADQVAAAKQRAEEEGVGFMSADVKQDASLTMDSVRQMIASGIDGLIIVVPDEAVGPQVLKLTEEAGIPVIASDARISDATGVINATLDRVNSGSLLGLPLPVVILVLMIAVFGIAMRFTVTGRNLYAVGGNPTAAMLAGIPVPRYLLGIYVLGGLIGGVAGVILTAKQGAGIPESGAADLALSSITAVVLGGAALTGGVGAITGTVLGVAILGWWRTRCCSST